jgi:glycosyltransferase involved in cell wall biosynthesis
LYVGRLKNAQKGICLLPGIVRECIQQQLPVTLTIIGDGTDREALEHAIAAEGVAHLIELRGAQPTANVYQAMQTHHVLLLPSNFEGLPLVLLEAQANGCVPIASRLPGITDAALEEGVSGLLAPPGDATAFAREVATLAEPGRWQTFSQAAIRRARGNYSTEIMGEHYHLLLGELAADATRLAQVRGRPDSLHSLFKWQDFIPTRLRQLRQGVRR